MCAGTPGDKAVVRFPDGTAPGSRPLPVRVVLPWRYWTVRNPTLRIPPELVSPCHTRPIQLQRLGIELSCLLVHLCLKPCLVGIAGWRYFRFWALGLTPMVRLVTLTLRPLPGDPVRRSRGGVMSPARPSWPRSRGQAPRTPAASNLPLIATIRHRSATISQGLSLRQGSLCLPQMAIFSLSSVAGVSANINPHFVLPFN